MNEKWRTIQIFLDSKEYQIYEVQLNPEDNSNLRCNCKFFVMTKGCKHVEFVKKIMRKNKGHYSVQVPEKINEVDVMKAMETPEDFRNFIIHHGKIEVIK